MGHWTLKSKLLTKRKRRAIRNRDRSDTLIHSIGLWFQLKERLTKFIGNFYLFWQIKGSTSSSKHQVPEQKCSNNCKICPKNFIISRPRCNSYPKIVSMRSKQISRKVIKKLLWSLYNHPSSTLLQSKLEIRLCSKIKVNKIKPLTGISSRTLKPQAIKIKARKIIHHQNLNKFSKRIYLKNFPKRQPFWPHRTWCNQLSTISKPKLVSILTLLRQWALQEFTKKSVKILKMVSIQFGCFF